MPELPEVETIRRGLEKVLVGKTIADFWSDWPRKVEPTVVVMQRQLKNKKIIAIRRRAKVLIFDIADGRHLLFHLKMSGQMIYQPKRGPVVFGGHPQPGGLDNLPNNFTHHAIVFTDSTTLYFNDQRKFGWVKLIDHQTLSMLDDAHGPEPLDKNFTVTVLQEILRRYPRRPIKQILLDQSLVAGLGNIYVDESLFAAGILPRRKGEDVTPSEVRRLHQVIRKIITLAIKYNGTSIDRLYVTHEGQSGNYAKYLKVYGRAGKSCKRCGQLIKKIKLAGRGTHYCPFCQK